MIILKVDDLIYTDIKSKLVYLDIILVIKYICYRVNNNNYSNNYRQFLRSKNIGREAPPNTYQ